MSSAALLRVHGAALAPGRPYAEREEHEEPWQDRSARALWHGALWPLLRPLGVEAQQRRAFVARVDVHTARLAALDEPGLRACIAPVRHRLRADGFTRDAVAECFALVREAAGRVLGKRHYPVQLGAGWWLMQGTLVEMATGEGKTFAATLPAVTAALAGLAVHVITVNDYLAARDAETMAPLYRFFGLESAAVVHGMARDERRRLYAGHITYASNKELAFDYLRDRASLGDRASPLHLAVESVRGVPRRRVEGCVLRGLVFAIVDEADSVFIDEARTPLILSATAEGGPLRETCDAAVAWARRLVAGEHFGIERAARRIQLLQPGRDRLADWRAAAGPANPLGSERACEESIQRALSALHLYALDQHYMIVAGKVQIVDEATGRTMPDRAWEHGLHQMIESKEGLELSGARVTLARITYQRLFRRYLRLAGMTGTATEVAAEIGCTYALPVLRVPLHRPSQRRVLAPRCLPDADAKWCTVADAVEAIAVRERRPVLVGTRTVKASEALAAVLTRRGIEHVVLNARQDDQEAQIIARAGEAGRVTVATNMAGRGTDILLGLGVAERGGLHVILTEYHESRRTDRQLFGRTARQGDPGSAQAIVALDDALFTDHAAAALALLAGPRARVGRAALAVLRRIAQSNAERRNRDTREASLRQDRRFAQLLAFSGRGE